ncbi:MAG: NAD(+) synthase [Cytophagales bacterium]|nr:NAD(+) synthase [Cytophagales bacterium]
MATLRIAGATVNQIPFDWDNNVSNILAAIANARSKKADIVCLPELCITGYGCEDMFLSDWLSATAWQKLKDIVPACHGMVVCIGLPVRISSKTYNGVCVIRNEKILGITLKQNLAKEGVHYEPRWFEAWKPGKVIDLTVNGESVQAGDLVYEALGITFGFEICEDAWSVNRPGKTLAKRGVDLIMNPSASHFALSKCTAREKQVVIDGSAAFACAYLFVNHLGNEAGRMIYDGDIVVGQHGKLLAVNPRLSFGRFNVLTCLIDTENPDASETQPMLDGRERNDEFIRAASLALFDYLRKSKAKGFVLSLSGGADSACCAVLVSEMVRRASAELGWPAFWQALGADASNSPTSQREAVKQLLVCAYQATRHSSDNTFQAARTLSDSIGAKFFNWSVDDEYASYTQKIETAIGRPLTWEQDDVSLQNIQARTRAPIIWLLANVSRCILLTTSNRSEGAVGYTTMDGDTSGSLSPLAGIDKPFILQWLRWAEKSLGYKGLQQVNAHQPTAELRPADRAQTDEKDLMPYDVLVAIEKLAIRDRKLPVAIYQELKGSFDPESLRTWIKKFFRLWSANQWKRERLAPSFHLDDHNIDPRSWCRFPILSGGFQEELKSLDQV